MRALPADASRRRPAIRRWAALLVSSVAFHTLVLGAFALRLPALRPYAEPRAIDVSLVPPPRSVRPIISPTAPRPMPVETRLVVLPAAPRYAGPARAPTGEAGDAADLFGPVFADGVWPRPILVKSEPCDREDEPRRAEACRRELMLIRVASDAAAGAKPPP